MSETRKRTRRRFGGHAHKKQKGARELEVGAQGVLITCNMNERKCTSEAYSLLSEYADELYGPEQESVSEDEEQEDEDAECALQREVSQLQSSSKGHQQRFSAVDSGANNVVFIRTHGVDPAQLVHHILSDLHLTRKRKSRVILRMLPVSATCRAFPEDMQKLLSVFLQRWFQAPRHATFQICFKARNSSHSKREEVITAVAGLVGQLNPLNKVDLTNPELSIIIEIIKSVCCVSVVTDYMLFRKYNLQEVAKEPANQNTGPQETANQNTGTKETANQNTGSQETANQNTDPQEAANKNTDSKGAANQNAGPQKTANESKDPAQEAANQTQEHGNGALQSATEKAEPE